MKEKLLKIDFSVLAVKYNLSLIMLFGSEARLTANKESDIDIAYLSKKYLSLEEEIALEEEISKLINSDRVQLVNISTASPLFLREIVRDGFVLYQSDIFVYENLKSYAYKAFVETKFLREMRHARLIKKYGKICFQMQI